MKSRRRPLAGCVVEDAFGSDRRKWGPRIDGQRLPGLQSILQLIGKHVGIAGCLECLLRNFAGNLVMAVAVRDAADKRGNNHLRPDAPHCQHRVVEHALVSPFGKRLRLSF